MKRLLLIVTGVLSLLGCGQGVEQNLTTDSSVETSTTIQEPSSTTKNFEGYCRSLTTRVAVFTVSDICPDVELCLDSGDNCFVGSTDVSEMRGQEIVVVLDDAHLLTYSRKKDEPWSLIRNQNIWWLKEAKGLELPETTLVEMALIDLTKDGVVELVVRAGPEELMLAAQSRDLAVFTWSQDNSSWIRMKFPRPVYPHWGTETKNITNRLLRWGFVRNGYVYEEVGYLDVGGHVMDKAFKYEWRNGEFVQVEVVDEDPACFDVVGASNDVCYTG